MAISLLTSGEVLQNGGGVDGSGGTDAAVGGGAALQETVNTTDRELEACNFENDRRKNKGLEAKSLKLLCHFSHSESWQAHQYKINIKSTQEILTGTSGTGDGLLLVTGTLDTDGTLGTLSGQSLCTLARHGCLNEPAEARN